MPLTEKGQEIMTSMKKEYGEKKGESVFYASENKGTITGVHDAPGFGGEGVESTLDSAGYQPATALTLQEINERNRKYWDVPGGSMFTNDMDPDEAGQAMKKEYDDKVK